MISPALNHINDKTQNVRVANPSEVISSSRPRLIEVDVEKIQGIHPSIIKLGEELDIPPQKIPARYVESLTSELLSILSRSYPHVFRDKRLWCVGNLRAFKIAKKISPPDMQIICVELFNLTDEQIRTSFINEYLLDPAIFGLHASDVGALAASARKAIAKDLLRSPNCSIEAHLSKLYCVDKRKLQQHFELI